MIKFEALVRNINSFITSSCKKFQNSNKLFHIGITRLDINISTDISDGSWQVFDRLPQSNLRTYLTHYLDITTPPPPSFLEQLSHLATSNADRDQLNLLSKVSREDLCEQFIIRHSIITLV